MATGDTLIPSRPLELTTSYGRLKFREKGMDARCNLPVIEVQQGPPVVSFPPDIRQVGFHMLRT